MLPIDHLALQVRAVLAIDAATRRALAAFASLFPVAISSGGGAPTPGGAGNHSRSVFPGEVNPTIADRKHITVTP